MLTAQDYGVRVIRAWDFQRVGNVIFPPGLLRDRLVQGGFVERITEPTAPEKNAKAKAATT